MRKHRWKVGGGETKACALAAFALTLPAAAQPISRWQPLIAEASVRFGIPVAWIERVMRAESGGRTSLGGRPIVSHAGAMGLMQLMPGTWAEMRAAHELGDDPHDPRDNILAGTAYLRLMYDRFGYPGMFAAYNAGPARYTDHLARGRALPQETRLSRQCRGTVSRVADRGCRTTVADAVRGQAHARRAEPATDESGEQWRGKRARRRGRATDFRALGRSLSATALRLANTARDDERSRGRIRFEGTTTPSNV